MSGIGRNRTLPFVVAVAMLVGITACTLRIGDPPVASDDVAATATAARDQATVTSEATSSASSDATPEGRASEQVSAEFGKWVTVGDMSTERADHTATLLGDGTVLVVGAGTYGADLYLPASRTFRSVDNPRCEHGDGATATLLADGRVLVVGGSVDLSCAELYDPATQLFTKINDTRAGRWMHSATLLTDGRVLLAGGVKRDGTRYVQTATAELFDPTSETFTETASMRRAQFHHAALVLRSGLVLVVGGATAEITSSGRSIANDCHASSELYDPVAEEFRPTPAPSFNVCRFTASLLPDGNVLVTSDQDPAEVFQPSAERFRPSSIREQARFSHTATTMISGNVLIAGGQGRDRMLSSAMIFDAGTEELSAIPEMSTPRVGHMATLLLDGSILVTGGWDGSRTLRSAELFVPAGVVLDPE